MTFVNCWLSKGKWIMDSLKDSDIKEEVVFVLCSLVILIVKNCVALLAVVFHYEYILLWNFRNRNNSKHHQKFMVTLQNALPWDCENFAVYITVLLWYVLYWLSMYLQYLGMQVSQVMACFTTRNIFCLVCNKTGSRQIPGAATIFFNFYFYSTTDASHSAWKSVGKLRE